MYPGMPARLCTAQNSGLMGIIFGCCVLYNINFEAQSYGKLEQNITANFSQENVIIWQCQEPKTCSALLFVLVNDNVIFFTYDQLFIINVLTCCC